MSGEPVDLDELLPADRIVECTFRFALPAAATKQEILDWVCLALGVGGCDAGNPLENFELDAIQDPILADTKRRLQTEETRNSDGTTSARSYSLPDSR